MRSQAHRVSLRRGREVSWVQLLAEAARQYLSQHAERGEPAAAGATPT
jgi:hypothetical protein